MASEAQIEKRRQVLRARGVPEKFVEALATREDGRPKSRAPILLLVAIGFSVLGSIFGGLELAPRLYSHVQPALLVGSYAEWFFAWLLGLGIIAFTLVGAFNLYFPPPVRAWPAYDVQASAMRVMAWRKQTLASVRPKPAYQQFGNLDDDRAFLAAVNRLNARGAWRWPLTACLIFGALVAAESQSYWRLTPTQFEDHQIMGSQVYQLDDVREALFMCSERRGEYFTQYWLVFPNGRYDIVQKQPGISLAKMIARVGKVNDILLAKHIPVHLTGYMRDADGVAHYNACLMHWRRQFGGKIGAFPQPLPES